MAEKKDAPTPQASAHTVTSASVGTALTQGAGTITAFTMNQPTSAQTDDLTPLTLVDPAYTIVSAVSVGTAGTGTAGTGVYAVQGGVGSPATVNVTSTTGGISAVSVASGGQYTTFPPSPASLTFVSGTGSLTGSTINLTEAMAPGIEPPSRVLFSANMLALKCMYEPRPNVPLTPGVTAPTWPKTLLGAGTVPTFNNGCWVQSCPANMTFTVTC